MQVLIAAAIVVATTAVMELVAASMHRYVMHGWGWSWHRSHHRKRRRGLEKNDLYAVFFSLPALLLTALARPAGPAYWCGIGIALYGLLYAIVHDGLVHRLFPFRIPVRTRYLHRLVEAHHLHH